MEKNNKKQHKHKLGQYFTTNYQYILQNFYIPDEIKTIIEPFVGNGDLLNFISDKTKYTIECYDIEPRNSYTVQRDTILFPPSYFNKFVLSNPPYIARNKSDEKTLFNKYDVNDLYKCFIKEILINRALGGIIIIPLNFWCSIRKKDAELRKDFLKVYSVIQLNIFEEQVFQDTTTTVCSFQFKLKTEININHNIAITIFPLQKKMAISLNAENNYTIGGHLYQLETSGRYRITRLTTKNQYKKSTNILAKCIDDNRNNKIGLSIVNDENIYIDDTPNNSSRTYATLIIEPEIDLSKQNTLVERWNEFIETNRSEYHSLFLTNFRESSDIGRKRISFELVYRIAEYILDQLE